MRSVEQRHELPILSYPNLVVSDIDAIYASAKMAGAKMVIELAEKDHGGKAFSCSDPEGHVWHFGTFDPWEALQG
jgi:uncharacterized glyoxalase superfamily protein PhnB